MVAVAPPLLSDQPPEVPRRAGLGDRFHYFRGASGRRYLFSTVPQQDLGDFRSAVVVLARRQASGRLAAYCTMILDLFGRPSTQDRYRLRSIPADAVALVHLLADNDRERHELIEDLLPLSAAAA
jgi:hypothetical protein